MDSPRWKAALLLALLAALAVAAYGPALNGGLIWDDDAHVTKPALRSLHGLWLIWTDASAAQQYYPVAHTVFWLQYHLWGEHTLGYHLVNLALHFASAVLVWLILRRLGLPELAGALAAAIFALHPVHVESVAWISELKNTLSGFCYLAAMLAYLHFEPPGEPPPERRPKARTLPPPRRWELYGLALVLFSLGLLSKTVIASLPAALLVIYWWRRGGWRWLRALPALVPFLVLGLTLGLITAWVEHRYIGARGEAFSFNVVERTLIAGRVVWFYAGKLVWPADLVFIYPRWSINAWAWWQYLFPAAAAGLLLSLWLLRRRLGRGPLAAVLFFGGTLFPALGFVNVFPFVYSFVADHFQYLASLGLIVLVAALLAEGLRRVGPERAWAGWVVAGGVALALALLSHQRAYAFRDVEAIYRDTLARNPGASMAHNNYGVFLRNRRQEDAARSHFMAAVAAEPTNSIAQYNLGASYMHLEKWREAATHLREAVRLNPYAPEGHRTLAYALQRAGRTDEAAAFYRNALKLRPGDAEAAALYGTLLLEQGQTDAAMALIGRTPGASAVGAEVCFQVGLGLETRGLKAQAIEYYRRAVAQDPTLAEGHNNLGACLRDLGQTEAALACFRQAVAADPRLFEARLNLGQALAQAARNAEAAAEYREAVRIRPDQPEARYLLGSVLLLLGRNDQAIVELQAAVRLQPDHAEAWRNLGQALGEKGRASEALTCFQKAVAIAPADPVSHFLLGRGWLQVQEPERAIPPLEEALRLKPGWPDALELLATARRGR